MKKNVNFKCDQLSDLLKKVCHQVLDFFFCLESPMMVVLLVIGLMKVPVRANGHGRVKQKMFHTVTNTRAATVILT